MHKAVAHTYRTATGLERPGGMRILAVDGSRLSLPESPAVRRRFSARAKGPGCEGPPQARICVCMDLLNGIVIDALIRPLSWGERRMASKHLRFVGDGDLLLLDRGYAGVDFFKRIVATGADICARVKLGHSRPVTEFVRSGRDSAIVHLTDGRESLRLRAVRIELPGGTVEVLLTSLVDWRCESEFFGQLYNLRWGVESQYHFLKAPLQLENFTGKTVVAVEQDFYAHVFAASLFAMLALPVHAEIERITVTCRHTYQLECTNAFALLRRHLAKLLLGPAAAAVHLLGRLLEHMTKYRDIIRTGRHFPRKHTVRAVRYPMNQKSV